MNLSKCAEKITKKKNHEAILNKSRKIFRQCTTRIIYNDKKTKFEEKMEHQKKRSLSGKDRGKEVETAMERINGDSR